MIHLGAHAFEELNGEVVQTTSFVIRKNKINKFKGVYIRLLEYNNSTAKESNILNFDNRFVASQESYLRIKAQPFAYWISDIVLNSFE